MEPNDFRPSVARVDVPQHQEYFHQEEFRPISPQTEFVETVERSVRAPAIEQIPVPAAQSFLPSFFRDAQPLGHSRPYYTQSSHTEPINHRVAGNRGGYDQSILGSGDFGVIRGGTFYQDNDPPVRGLESNDFYSFYKNNGHGRPQAQPFTSHKYNSYGDDQFSNFRDFADINTPTDPAYSQFVVVYANKNSTSSEIRNPKNIFEQLQLLDAEDSSTKKISSTKKTDQLSKYKTKLANTKLEKKYKKKLGPKDNDYEPLLALS